MLYEHFQAGPRSSTYTGLWCIWKNTCMHCVVCPKGYFVPCIAEYLHSHLDLMTQNALQRSTSEMKGLYPENIVNYHSKYLLKFKKCRTKNVVIRKYRSHCTNSCSRRSNCLGKTSNWIQNV